MIECLPTGLCSWNFRLVGSGVTTGRTEHDWVFESGRIELNGTTYEVEKQGFATGLWNFRECMSEKILMEAQKSSAFSRTFELCSGANQWTIRAESVFGRSMILKGVGVECSYVPHHPFTRRARIDGYWEDVRVVVFGFWLAALMWKRAQESD